MDSIDEILGKYDFAEPDEIAAIKKYVKEKYDSAVMVRVSGEQIIISAPSAALAGTIRSNWTELENSVKSDKKLVLRIG